MSDRYDVYFLEAARTYVEGLAAGEQGAIAADIDAMRAGELQIPNTKQLRRAVRELISGHHRITYVLIANSIYFIRGFRKKTDKTPKAEIEYAEKIWKQLKKP
ncbi:MAG: type II toxin-antitoxin system RelE/ParE family toxin [bacterium]